MKTATEKELMIANLQAQVASLPDENHFGESNDEDKADLQDLIDTIKGNGSNDEAQAWLDGEESDLDLM